MNNFKAQIANAIGAALILYSEGKTTGLEVIDGVDITRQAIDNHDWSVEARSDTFWVHQASGAIGATYEGDIFEALNWAYPAIMTPEFLTRYTSMNEEFPGEIVDNIATIQMIRQQARLTTEAENVGSVQLVADLGQQQGIPPLSPGMVDIITQVLSDDLMAQRAASMKFDA